MPFDFYQNYIDNIAKSHKESHIQMKQNQINQLFYNNTQCETIKEQDGVGLDTYHDVEVIVDMALDTGTGVKLSDDFKVLAFKDMRHDVSKGIQYKFYDEIWLATDTSEIVSPTKDIMVRRCNNTMKWIDENGVLHKLPCVIGYDISKSQPREEKTVITPSNSMTVIVQGNTHTLKLDENQRFLFNKRPYKLSGINNALQNSEVNENTTLLYYDLYLDTLLPSDDLVNNIAGGFENKYEVKILDNIKEQVEGFIGDLDCAVMLNGKNVDMEVTWSGNEYVTIDENGTYTLTGMVGNIAIVKATLKDTNISDEISINIVPQTTNDYKLVLNPLVESISQYSTARFSAYLYNNGIINFTPLKITHSGEIGAYHLSYVTPNTLAEFDDITIEDVDILKLEHFDGISLINITCLKPSTKPLYVTFENIELGFKQTIQIELKPMF